MRSMPAVFIRDMHSARAVSRSGYFGDRQRFASSWVELSWSMRSNFEERIFEMVDVGRSIA